MQALAQHRDIFVNADDEEKRYFQMIDQAAN